MNHKVVHNVNDVELTSIPKGYKKNNIHIRLISLQLSSGRNHYYIHLAEEYHICMGSLW